MNFPFFLKIKAFDELTKIMFHLFDHFYPLLAGHVAVFAVGALHQVPSEFGPVELLQVCLQLVPRNALILVEGCRDWGVNAACKECI